MHLYRASLVLETFLSSAAVSLLLRRINIALFILQSANIPILSVFTTDGLLPYNFAKEVEKYAFYLISNWQLRCERYLFYYYYVFILYIFILIGMDAASWYTY